MYPTLGEVRELERATLRAISEIGVFGRLGDLQAAAKQARNHVGERGPVNVHLGFFLDIRLRSERDPRRRRVDVGALVEPSADHSKISNASYGVLLCESDDPSTGAIVRKLHFDYAPLELRADSPEPKPTVHIQVCGQLSSHHHQAGYTQDSLEPLFPSWEKPRVPAPPVSLAILLNWLFMEFQSDVASQQVLKDERWRKLVAGAERTVLLRYFEQATRFLKSAGNEKKRFLQAYLYETKD